MTLQFMDMKWQSGGLRPTQRGVLLGSRCMYPTHTDGLAIKFFFLRDAGPIFLFIRRAGQQTGRVPMNMENTPKKQ